MENCKFLINKVARDDKDQVIGYGQKSCFCYQRSLSDDEVIMVASGV